MYQCDFCNYEITPDYEPIGTKRNVKVAICSKCGLIQSKYLKKNYQSQPPGSMSCDADRSSFRYTKTLVAKKYSKYLNNSKLNNSKTILDIGSNRGAFIKYLDETYQNEFNILAIEPHKDSCINYENKENVEVVVDRVENVRLKDKKFDFVYCVHTLEHVNSASEVLEKIFISMKDDGQFFLTVPKYELYKDVVEELFIDPHTFHFSKSTLIAFIQFIGFKILEIGEDNDDEIILLLTKPSIKEKKEFPNKFLLNQNFENIINNYSELLTKNRKIIKKICEEINFFSSESKVIIWGAGRIFDSLISIGNLQVNSNILIIDKYLSLYMQQIRGFNIFSPEKLNKCSKDSHIFILSRAFNQEIKKEAIEIGFRKFHCFSDYFDEF